MAMIDAADLGSKLEGLGFERVQMLAGSTYRDSSTIIVVPTRGKIDHRVIARWLSLLAPMNQRRGFMWAVGDEVGHAYNNLITAILADPHLSTYKYILTLEDDNLPPLDAHIRLLESIEKTGFDAVSGLYFTKGEINMPMAYGDPASGVFDFKPRDVRSALRAGEMMPVNGIAMGCALWRLDLFREIKAPWFVTVSDLVNGTPQCFTQDLKFCERAVKSGKRFGVDMRVRVGHLDVNTGVIY